MKQLALGFVALLALTHAASAGTETEAINNYHEGLTVTLNGKVDLGIEYFTKAIDSGDLPHDILVFAHNNRANNYYLKGEYDRAIAEYTKVLSLHPYYTNALNYRGIIYNHKGNHQRAIQDFNAAIKLRPNDPLPYGNRGFAWERLGKRQRAIQDYQRQYNMGNRPQWLVDRLKALGGLK